MGPAPSGMNVGADARDDVPSGEEAAIVRAREGDMGMFFRFGGLSSLLADNNSRVVRDLILTQVGMKYVLSENLILPVYFGGGFRRVAFGGDSAMDAGLDVGFGIEYHFRVWRRISPFIGGSAGVGLSDPEGDDNLVIGLGLGPLLGVEYYVADRVSLTAQYFLVFQFESIPVGGSERATAIALATLAGGALNLSFYF